ncbi:hypothetical protein AB0D12_31995 [Streptomyces sp. NPDC048479]|uniref:hypothetical protein n=1 Tax=Streptomyces sp. NPDC048479 TaxID=3154725 RepID=UPI00343DD91C
MSGHTPTAPVAAHLRSLVAGGRSLAGIARESGANVTTVRRVYTSHRPTIWTSTADKLMAVQRVPDSTALVDATGTVRRLRALVAMGHDQRSLCLAMPCAYTAFSMLTHGRKRRVTVATEQAARRLYNDRSMMVGQSTYGRNLAAKYGWHGPLAWDDDTIDDPNAMPQTDALEPAPTQGADVASRFLMGESVVLDRPARKEVISYLMEWTDSTPEQVGERLDMKADAVSRAWERIKDKARKDGGKVPWRRVYVPKQCDLTQDEMESVA